MIIYGHTIAIGSDLTIELTMKYTQEMILTGHTVNTTYLYRSITSRIRWKTSPTTNTCLVKPLCPNGVRLMKGFGFSTLNLDALNKAHYRDG